MNELEAMRVFARVAELGSFTRAAEDLSLPKASVSTAVQRLETRLGTRLLHRTTRRVQLTQDGRVFYDRGRELLSDMDELQSMFRQSAETLRGRLRVDMPTGAARNFVIPRLPQFLDAHPHLEIELSGTDRRVDLVREGFDCVLRVGPVGDANLIARSLGSYHVVNCASPVYLQRYGTPQTLDDLAEHRLIHYVTTFGAKPDGFEYFDGERYRMLPMRGALTVNNAESYEAACLAGLGLIQVPGPAVRRLIEQGALVEVLPQWSAEPMPISLLYAHRRNLPRRVQVFMNWVADILRPYLESAGRPAV